VAGESLSGQSGWLLTGLAPGTLVAGYRVESRIGAGGMAMVFRARDESLGRTVALKILTPALADDSAFRERFIRESRAAAVVDHPHIIPVYGAGEFGGVLYIAMRFVAGGDLRGLIQREGPLSASRAAFLLSPLASALDAAHAAGLVHRDVKPANVLIDTSPGRPDHLYLSDFGLAKGTSSTGLTGTGQFLGTLDYCAPEQIGGKPSRPQTDQYALACVAYTMFTGTVPFPRDEATAILWAHMSEPPPSVSAVRADLRPAVDLVFARAMAKNPEERYLTCSDFADALRTALGLGTYTTPSSVYSAITQTGAPFPLGNGQMGPPVPAVRLPVRPSLPTPLAAPGQAPVPKGSALPSAPAMPHAPTQSSYPDGFTHTAEQEIPQPSDPSAPVTSPPEATGSRRSRRGLRAGVLAAAAVVVAGGAIATAVLLSQQDIALLSAPRLIATLTFPDANAALSTLSFTSDDTLVTVDSNTKAYSWDIAEGSYTTTNYDAAAAQAPTESVTLSGGAALRLIAGGRLNDILVLDVGTGKVVDTLTSPQGTDLTLGTFSKDGTEVAAVDLSRDIYVWKIA
jgi:serine/threonine protein kinase